MSSQVRQWSEAPAGTYSPFAKDERCYEVHYVCGDTYNEVLTDVTSLRMRDKTLIDYDINWDSTVEKWVGVTCRDV